MKLTIVKGKTVYSASDEAIRQLGSFDVLERINVVVPDAASLLTERQILNVLNIDGYFNFDVTTKNRIANEITKSSNIKPLSNFAMVAIVKDILAKNQHKLKSFKNSTKNINFSKELYQTILQIKSSGLTPDELKVDAKLSTGLTLKIEDIKLVWKEYEKIVETLSDEPSKFEEAIKRCVTSDFVKNSHFAFLNFLDLTYLDLEFIKALTKHSKSVVVSTSSSAIENNLKAVAERLGFKPIVVETKNFKTKEQEHLLENVFKFDAAAYKKEGTTSAFTTVQYETVREEVYSTISKICELKTDLNDVAVAVTSIATYKNEIESICNMLDVSYSILEETPLSTFAFPKFILGIVKVFKSGFNRDDFLELSKNKFSGLTIEENNSLETFMDKKGIEAYQIIDHKKTKHESVSKLVAPLLKQYEKYRTAKTVDSKAAAVLNTAVGVAHLCDPQHDEHHKKTIEILAELANLPFVIECDDLEFFNILSTALNSRTIRKISPKLNALKIYDINQSQVERCKHLFILGAHEGAFPTKKLNTGLLLDEDLEAFGENKEKKIEPTIRHINQKAQEKCLDLLTVSDFVDISFSTIVNGEEQKESLLLFEIKKLLGLKSEKVKRKMPNIKETKTKREMFWLYSELSKKAIEKDKELELDKERMKTLSVLSEVFKNESKTNIDYKIKNSKELFLGAEEKPEIYPTKLESFFKCPFRNFLDNGIRAKEKEYSEARALDIGNIYHDFFEEFVKVLIELEPKHFNGFMLTPSLTKKAEAVMKEVLLKKDYKELLEKPENKMLLKIVKAETPKLAYNILYHHVSSNFRPTKKSLEKKINLDMGDFILKGKADRVDFCENQFRIIDYKTGSSEKKFSFAELFYGQALQLPLYALGVQSETKKKAVGIFYYPAHNKKKENEFSARLSGPVLNDIIVLRNLDNAFNRDYEAENGIISETITAAINKAGTRENRWHYPKSMLDNSDFQKMLDYAKSVTKSGVGEILKGYVEPSVLEDQRLPCEFCPYMKLGQCENKILRTKKNIKM